jgi:hypothetical protein
LGLHLLLVVGLAILEDLARLDVRFGVLPALAEYVFLVAEEVRLDIFEVTGKDVPETLLQV